MSYPNSPTKAFFPSSQPPTTSTTPPLLGVVCNIPLSNFRVCWSLLVPSVVCSIYLVPLQAEVHSMLVVNIRYPDGLTCCAQFSMQAPPFHFFIPFRDTFLFGTIIFSDASNGGSAHIAPSLSHPTVLTELFRAVFPIMTFMQAGIVVLPDDVWL